MNNSTDAHCTKVTAVCRFSSSCDSTTVTLPASSGMFWTIVPGRPNVSARVITSWRRSSVMVPLAVSMAGTVSFSRMLTIVSCAPSVCLRPDLSGLRGGQEPIYGLGGRSSKRGRKYAGQTAEVARKQTVELLGDIDVRIELTDHERGDRATDLGVGEQFVGCFDPVVGVEDLPVDPDAHGGDEQDHRPEDDEQVHPHRVGTSRYLGGLGGFHGRAPFVSPWFGLCGAVAPYMMLAIGNGRTQPPNRMIPTPRFGRPIHPEWTTSSIAAVCEGETRRNSTATRRQKEPHP